MFFSNLLQRLSGQSSTSLQSTRKASCELLEPRRLLTLVYQVDTGSEVVGQELGEWTGMGAQGSGSVTLNLSGLPEHSYLYVGITARFITSEWGVPGPSTDTYTIACGEESDQTVVSDQLLDDFAGADLMIPHTGSSATITFSAADIDPEESWAVLFTDVYAFDPTLSIEGEVITVGTSEEVTVTARDPWGQTMEDVQINLESLDPGIISPQQSTVTTGEDGTAVVDVEAVAPGYADLKATTQGRGPATTQQAGLKISTEVSQPGVDGVAGAIADLDSEVFATRSAAITNLTKWSRHFPSVFDALIVRRKAGGNTDNMNALLDTIIADVGFSVRFDGPDKLVADLSHIKLGLAAGETVSSLAATVSITPVRLRLYNPIAPENRTLTIVFPDHPETDPTIGIVARGVGEVSVSFTVYIRNAQGEVVREIDATVPLRISDQQ